MSGIARPTIGEKPTKQQRRKQAKPVSKCTKRYACPSRHQQQFAVVRAPYGYCGCNLVQEVPTAYKPVRPYRLPLTRSAGTCPCPTCTVSFIMVRSRVCLPHGQRQLLLRAGRVPQCPRQRRNTARGQEVCLRCPWQHYRDSPKHQSLLPAGQVHL